MRWNRLGSRFATGLALVLLVAVAACSSTSSGGKAPRTYALDGVAMATCTLTSSRGVYQDARCGNLTVPENRADTAGRKIQVYVVILPARDQAAAAEPVFFIAGGPGGSTVSSWADAPSIFQGLNQHHDIVLVDQRGTGSSNQLVLPSPNPGESPADYGKRALTSIDGDPRYYTTAVAMDDLDAVRAAIGYGSIDLYGGSYGATAVQYYIRQHGEHVHAAVMDGGTLIEVPILQLIARNSQLALDDVFNRCLADTGCSAAYPNVRAELAGVLNRLAQGPVHTFVVDTGGNEIILTPDSFSAAVHQLLVISQSGRIPWLIHAAWTGNYAAAGQALASVESPDTPTLVMYAEIVCSEAWAKDDPAQVKATGAGSYLLAGQLAFAEQVAQACKTAPPGYVTPDDAQPVHTSVPVLLLNGSDDPQDPPSNVAAAAQEMPNSLLVIAPGMGHTVGHIGCLPQVVVRFLDEGKTNAAAASACTSTMSPPQFQLS